MTEALTPTPQQTQPAPARASAMPDVVAIVVIGVFAIVGLIEVRESLAWILLVLMGRKVPVPAKLAGKLPGSGLMALLVLPLTLVSRRYG